MNDKEQIVDILYQEYKRACEESQNYLAQNEKVVQFAFAAISGFAWLGYKNDLPLLLLMVPIVFSGLLIYIANAHEFSMISRGYAASIENRINDLFSPNQVLFWETKCAGVTNHYRGSTCTLIVLGVTIALTISAIAIIKASTSLDVFWVVTTIGITVLLNAYGVVRLFNLTGVRNKAMNSCKEICQTTNCSATVLTK